MPFDSPSDWRAARSFHHSRYDEAMLARASEPISVCLPARECAATIGPIVETLVGMRERGAIDELVVIDGGSPDGTARIAADAGATVYPEAELMPDSGRCSARATRCGGRSACSRASSSASSTRTCSVLGALCRSGCSAR